MIESRSLGISYLTIKRFVIDAGYASEVDWQADVEFDQTSESDFLREAAWVVLSSGFRECVPFLAERERSKRVPRTLRE